MPTYQTARRALAQEIGRYGSFTAVGGSTSTLICPTAFQSTELPTSALANAWIFLPAEDGARQRRVKADGLDASTGTITVDAAFGSAVASGDNFEVHGRLPAERQVTDSIGAAPIMGLKECLNAALRHLLVPDDGLSLSLVHLARDYSLSSWPWLDRKERLVDVREPNADGRTYRPLSRYWELREGVAENTLHIPQPYRITSGSHSLRLVALRPADTKIAVAGTWGDSTAGLVNETDQFGPDLNAVVTVALVFAYKALWARGGPMKATYARLYAAQLREARKVRNYDLSNDIDPTVPATDDETAEAE